MKLKEKIHLLLLGASTITSLAEAEKPVITMMDGEREFFRLSRDGTMDNTISKAIF